MYSALLLVDKPSGPTSHDIVNLARKVLKTKAVGHTGTLDPLASGLMVLILGEATKLSQYLMDGNKEYEVRVEFGKISDTYDREGQIVSTGIKGPDLATLKNVLLEFRGKLNLKVPAFSAVKVDGKSLMERARNNQEIPEVFREMEFFDVELLDWKCPFMTVRLECSKGAYVRSWVHELGQKLGCGALVSELRRTVNSGFQVENAVVLNRELSSEVLTASSAWVSIEQSLKSWPRIPINDSDERLVRNGQLPSHIAGEAFKTLSAKGSHMAFLQSQNSQKLTSIISLGEDAKVRINRVFTY